MKLTSDQKKEYISCYLLEHLATKSKKYSVLLEGHDEDLEDLFVFMMSKDYVKITEDNHYEITERGEQKLEDIKKRYSEYLAHFDIYCAVDLEDGFAFEEFFSVSQAQFEQILNEERFDDLRLAVGEYKNMNPFDIVFLSFLNEGRFGNAAAGWQFDLKSGLIWNEIENIVENAIKVEDLAYQDQDQQNVSGKIVIEDIISQGSSLNQKLHKQSDRETLSEDEEYYSDPQYKSDVWSKF